MKKKPMPPADKAILIESTILKADVWLVFDPAYEFDDGGLARFYASEMPKLRTKTEEQLIGIHKIKVAFKNAMVVR
jgi:hypothetical protein